MRLLRNVQLIFGACAIFGASSAQAQILQLSDSADIPVMTTNWSETRALDQFDPALGDLLSVRLTADANISGSAMFENQDAQPAVVTLNYSSQITVARSDNMNLLLTANPTFSTISNLAASDGVLDFAGPSGETFPNLAASDSVDLTFNAPFSADEMALFIGNGTFGIDVVAMGTSQATGAGNLTVQINTDAAATITVVYEYEGVPDCNGNMIDDEIDIMNGTSMDCNNNGTPDECEPDCNNNGIPDDCDPTECLCLEFNRRTPGSLLLYPEYQNGPGKVTVYTVTNTSCQPSGSAVTIEFRYIDEETCGEANQTAVLTPCDTLTYLTSAHTGLNRGYGYIYAKSNQITPANPAGEPISFNHLVGQQLVVDGFTSFDYSVNAVAFKAIPTQGNPTDIDGPGGQGDGIRDLDNAEYEPAPDEIYIPRFMGQDQGPNGIYSELCLINLSGGAPVPLEPRRSRRRHLGQHPRLQRQ